MEVHLDYSPKSNGPTNVPSSSGPVPVEVYLDYSSRAGGSQKISNVICNGLCILVAQLSFFSVCVLKMFLCVIFHTLSRCISLS